MQHGTNENTRSFCADKLLDRGWGRPQQDNTLSGELNINIRNVLNNKKPK